MSGAMQIEIASPAHPDVGQLIDEHLADMYASSPRESVHALDQNALLAPGVTFWTPRRDGVLVGCAALLELDPFHGELKSMRTTAAARGTGVGKALLVFLVAEGRLRGYSRLSLETGTQSYFAPARGLYAGQGFTACGPFADYAEDPHSAFFTLVLAPAGDQDLRTPKVAMPGRECR